MAYDKKKIYLNDYVKVIDADDGRKRTLQPGTHFLYLYSKSKKTYIIKHWQTGIQILINLETIEELLNSGQAELKENAMKRKTEGKEIVIKEDVRIPGTKIILEKGDKIVVKEGKLEERRTDTATFYSFVASGLINGDYSGLDKDEIEYMEEVHRFIVDNFGINAQVVDVSEPYFGRPDVGDLRGDVADYTIMY